MAVRTAPCTRDATDAHRMFGAGRFALSPLATHRLAPTECDLLRSGQWEGARRVKWRANCGSHILRVRE
jgi:hypothetical protein